MSTALAIGAVTAVLKDLLTNGLIDHDVSAQLGQDVTVTTLAPDRALLDPTQEKTQLNLFLYQVTQNAAWRNTALPERNGRGARLSNPPLALDLHYMLTAYGEKELHAEILLGYGMQLLHETPVLTRDAIRRSLAPPDPLNPAGLPANLQGLYESGLAEQIEQIKICPISISTEEISRLWTAFQARYRPTAAYQATVVLIESRSSAPRAALPVRARNIYAIPFAQPVIEQVLSQVDDNAQVVLNQPILAGYNLIIAGYGLRSDDTRVNVGGIEVTPPASKLTGTQITVQLPLQLPAGVQGVQVVQYTPMDQPELPPVAHRGLASNVAAFVLRPAIQNVTANMQPNAKDPTVRDGTINLTVAPAVGRDQRVVLLLNEFDPLATPAAYSFPFPSPYQIILPPQVPPETATDLTIDVKAVKPATYLVRVQVDGAESPVLTDPATKKYNAPLLDIL